MKCESCSNSVQPGEGTSRGLLCDCEIFTLRSSLRALVLTHLVCQLAGVESVPHHGAGGGQDEAVSPHQDPATGQDGQVRLVPAIQKILLI